MIYVDVKNAKRQKKELTKKAVLFAFCCLAPRMRKDIEIEILFSRLHGVCGYQHETDDRCFEIELSNKLQGDDLLTAIFHEVTHCVQDLRKNKSGWELPYYERPFEIEAYEQQEIILKKWNKMHFGH